MDGIRIPPPPGAYIDVQTDLHAPWDDSLMCPNTPTKHDYSIQVWWPVGPMCQLAPKHPNWRDENYMHKNVPLLEGEYEILVCNTTFKLLKDHKKNSA